MPEDGERVRSIGELVDYLKRQRRTSREMEASALGQGDRIEAALRQGREQAFFEVLKVIGPLRRKET